MVRVEQLEDRVLLSSRGIDVPTPLTRSISYLRSQPTLVRQQGPRGSVGRITDAQVRKAVKSLRTTASPKVIFHLQGERVQPRGGLATPQTNASGPLINLDDVRSDPRYAGIDGSGFSVVIIDTGIDLNHSYFGPDANSDGIADRIVYSYDFYGANDTDASDSNGHGSNVASIAASSDLTYTGMAPGANIIALKVFDDAGTGAPSSDIEEALQWCVANAAAYNIASVNMSLGYNSNLKHTDNSGDWSDEFAALVSLNVTPVVAAGNRFYNYGSAVGVAGPSNDTNVIAVGAVYDASIGSVPYGGGAIAYSTAPDAIAPFSQRHPILTPIFAPGAAITGAYYNGGAATYHGTSQAAPHITGLIALAQELATQELGRRLTLDEIRSLLQRTGVVVNDGDNENDNVTNTGLDFRRVDALAMCNAILNMKPATLAGAVFEDRNGDWIAQPGESGLAGWQVFLDRNANGLIDSGTSTFSSSNVPRTIGNLDIFHSNLTIAPGLGPISDVNVRIDVTHTADSHLDIYLISPSGTRVQLVADQGGTGDNFNGTIFDDGASDAITSGSAPFAGTYRPMQSLTRIDGEDPTGTWMLEVGDDTTNQTGTLTAWSITLTCAEQAMLTPASGSYSFSGLTGGTFNPRLIAQANWVQTAPAGNPPVNVPAGQTTNLAFGQFPTLFTGAANGDAWSLRGDGAGRTQIWTNASWAGEPAYAVSTALLSSLTFNGGDGDDVLLVSTSNGSPIPADGISFSAGSGTGDRIEVGGSAIQVFSTSASSATFGVEVITFAGVESMTLGPGQFDITQDLVGLELTLLAGAHADFLVSQDLAGLELNDGASAALAGAGQTLVTDSLAIAEAATLDLNANAMILRSTSAHLSADRAAIWAAIRAAHNGGDWNADGLTSALAAADPDTNGVGMIVNDDGAGGVLHGTWNGVGGLTTTDILICATRYGDADMDGDVDGNDVGRWALHFTGELGGAGTKIWSDGDWDYDGDVDGNDVGRWALNFTGEIA